MKKFVFIVICFSNLPAFGQQRDTLRMEGHFYYLADIDSRTIAERIMNGQLRPSDFELYSNAAAYELYFSTDYKAEIEKLRRAVSDKCPACVGSNTIAQFLDVTAQKTADI